MNDFEHSRVFACVFFLVVPRYWENDDPRTSVSIVPTSALTGEGVPDLLYMILKLTQDLMGAKLECREELECTVIEVKNIEGLGTTIDVVLLNGTLREGDTIVLAGLGGPIVTTIRALLTPQPMKEMRVKHLGRFFYACNSLCSACFGLHALVES